MLPQSQTIQSNSAGTFSRSRSDKIQLITSSSPKVQELRKRYETMQQAASFNNPTSELEKSKS